MSDQETTSQLGNAVDGHARTNCRRAAPRVDAGQAAVTIYTVVSGVARTYEARLLDYSDGGLALLVTQPFAKGTKLTVMQADRTGDPVVVRVRYQRRQGLRWRVGCKFIR